MDPKVHVDELSRLAQVLNKETDSYTQSLARLEKSLREINLGLEVWIPLRVETTSGGPHRDTTIQTELGYAKLDDVWGFAVREMRVERGYWEDDLDCPWENHYPETEPRLLLKSSRELRIAAADKIQDLLEALQTETKRALESLRKAQAADPLTPRLEKSNDDLSSAEEKEIELYLLSSRNVTVPLTIEQLYNAFSKQHNVRSPQKTRAFMQAFFDRHHKSLKKELGWNDQVAYLWKRGV